MTMIERAAMALSGRTLADWNTGPQSMRDMYLRDARTALGPVVEELRRDGEYFTKSEDDAEVLVGATFLGIANRMTGEQASAINRARDEPKAGGAKKAGWQPIDTALNDEGTSMTMIERVQVAIEQVPYPYVERCDDDGNPIVQTLREFYENTWQGDNADSLFPAVARAVLQAIREPTELMISAGNIHHLGVPNPLDATDDDQVERENCATIFIAMVDAALAEK